MSPWIELSEISGSCLALQLSGAVDVPEVLANGAHVDVEQLGHQTLGQSDRLVLVARLDAGTAFLGGEDEELGCRVLEPVCRLDGVEVRVIPWTIEAAPRISLIEENWSSMESRRSTPTRFHG